MMTMRRADTHHVPVMCEEIVDLLGPSHAQSHSVHVDGTLGAGGHAEAVLTQYPGCTVVGIDRDPQALALATERLAPFGPRFRPVHAVFDELPEVLAALGVDAINTILLDLGMSSMHIDDAERGFAYREDAPLDMRMDPTTGESAADFLAAASTSEITRVLKEYGEERFASRIARAIDARRQQSPVQRTHELVELLREAIPAAAQRSGGHPAKRTFQALRIHVNRELDALAAVLPASLDALTVGGRCAVLSYHSLEDRMVKRAFSQGLTSRSPVGLPVERPEDAPYLAAVIRGAATPTQAEISANPRAASAKLRLVERTRIGGGTSS